MNEKTEAEVVENSVENSVEIYKYLRDKRREYGFKASDE